MTSELPAWLVSSGLWVGGFAALVTGVTVISVGVSKLVRIFRRVGHFLDDWAGEEGRPGVEARPGVMERLGSMEDRLGEVEHEVKTNTGTSLKDAAKRTEEAVNAIASRMEDVSGQVEDLARRDPPPVVRQDITIHQDPPT